MNYNELQRRVREYERAGIAYRISVVVFGKTDDEHLYAITALY